MDGNNYNNNNQNGSSDSFYSYNNGSQSNQQTEHAERRRTWRKLHLAVDSRTQILIHKTQDISRAVHIRMAHTRTQDISRTVLTRMVDIRIPTVHFIRTHRRLVKNKRKREKENRVDLERNLQNAQPSR